MTALVFAPGREFSVTIVAPHPLRHIEAITIAGKRPVIMTILIGSLAHYLAVHATEARAAVIAG